MTVVGHLEQMRRSACYQKSDTMSCLTCHDLHRREKPADSTAYYRQKCLNCHASRGCSLEPADRLKQSPSDDCSACHMPKGKTDIPHVAFTHHRVGRHLPSPSRPEGGAIPDLVAVDDNPRLAETDRNRNLGLAYLKASAL